MRGLRLCHAWQWRGGPPSRGWLGNQDLRSHIIENADRKPILGPTVVVNGAALTRLEQKVEATIAGHEGIEADRDQAVG